MRSERVLLISANRERGAYLIPPIALAHLAGALRGVGMEVRALDLLWEEDPIHAIEAALAEYRPDAVGVSVRNIDSVAYPMVTSFIPDIARIAECLRAWGGPTILGGSGVSIAPGALLDRVGLDVAVSGEGERILPRLVRLLSRKASVSGLPGVTVRGENGSLPPEPIRDLPGLRAPDYSILDLESYRAAGGVVGIQTKRGCPLDCTYCVYPGVEGAGLRRRPVAAIVEEVRRLRDERGIDRFFFVDSVFNLPPTNPIEIARGLSALREPIAFGCYLSPAKMTREIADSLVAAGCDGAEFGTDSLCDEILVELGKPFCGEDVRNASEACRAAGLPQCHHLIFGSPGETAGTMAETLERTLEVHAEAWLGMSGVRVYPDTGIARRLFPDEATRPDFLDPFHYVSPEVAESLPETLLSHAKRHGGWVLPGLGHNCEPEVFERIRATGFRGPAWTLLRRTGS